jgi:hypothetical protein
MPLRTIDRADAHSPVRGAEMRLFPMVVFVAGIALLSLTGCHTRVAQSARPKAIPDVLTTRGFGNPTRPVIVDWYEDMKGMAGSVTISGLAIPGTRWVFDDPAPVWDCFSGVRTRSFMPGGYVGSMAAMVVRLGPSRKLGEVIFHHTPGFATVLSPPGMPEGGFWELDPVVARRLAELLSARAPSELGVSGLRVHECAYTGPDRARDVSVRVCSSAKEWGALKPKIGAKYRPRKRKRKPLAVPKDFSWDNGLVVVAWVAPRNQADRLETLAARMAGDTLKWELAIGSLGREVSDYCPAAVGFFTPSAVRPTSVQIWLNGKKVQESQVPGVLQRGP